MHYNHTLKRAVTIALGTIAMGTTLPSFALGLSELELKSLLGEPLKASINVLGANEIEEPACIRLGNNSSLSHAHFKLGPTNSNGNANLWVSSTQAINEPIVNLSIIAGCNNVITRDYVLLLDPPASLLSNNTTDTDTSPVNKSIIVQKIDTADNSSPVNTAAPIEKTTVKTPKKKRRPKKAAKKTSKTIAKKSTGQTQTARQSTPAANKSNLQPRLSISGGTTNYEANSVGLRLDRQLQFTPNPNMAVEAESIAIEDEVTVMNNRLAHLQQQIAALQKKNASLTTENKLKTKQLNQANNATFSLPNIWPFLGAGLLLLAGFATYTGLRRRQTQLQSNQTNALWIDGETKNKQKSYSELESDNKNNDAKVFPEKVAAEEPVEEDIFADVNFGINAPSTHEHTDPPSMESTFDSTRADTPNILLEEEHHFSVLDHADVFLSHGRSTLAIQLLQNHLLEHPKQSVTIWLFLLDLLAKENLANAYQETADECKLHFNINISDFSQEETSEHQSLEDFPRLAKGLESVWNTPAAVTYLDDLIYNNRLEKRAGLPKTLIEELVLLRAMALGQDAPAEFIQLDEEKLALNEQKKALLESKKAEKLKKIEDDALKLAEEQNTLQDKADADDDTTFEFTLVDRN